MSREINRMAKRLQGLPDHAVARNIKKLKPTHR